MKLKNGVEEGGLAAVEGKTGVWHVTTITLRGHVYLRHVDTGEVIMVVDNSKVHPYDRPVFDGPDGF